MPEEPDPKPAAEVEKVLDQAINPAPITKVVLEGAIKCGFRAGRFHGAVRRDPATAPQAVQDWFLAEAEVEIPKLNIT